MCILLAVDRASFNSLETVSWDKVFSEAQTGFVLTLELFGSSALVCCDGRAARFLVRPAEVRDLRKMESESAVSGSLRGSHPQLLLLDVLLDIVRKKKGKRLVGDLAYLVRSYGRLVAEMRWREEKTEQESSVEASDVSDVVMASKSTGGDP